MSARDKIQGKIDAITLLRRDMAQMERAKTLVPADPTEGQADYWMVQGLDALRRQWQERIQRLADELNGLTGMATPGAFDELVAGPARMITVAVIEAGEGYTDRVARLMIEVSGDERAMIEQAQTEVAARGYRVMPDEEGGCCEYCQEIDAYGNVQESIAITVYPEPARE